MSHIPENLKFTRSHEWVRQESDGTVTIGVTDHAQTLLGDIVFVELPEVDSDLKAGAESGVVESVKAASDIYSPVDGKITAVNEALSQEPHLINQEPYEAGWLFKLAPANKQAMGGLLDTEAYRTHLAEEE